MSRLHFKVMLSVLCFEDPDVRIKRILENKLTPIKISGIYLLQIARNVIHHRQIVRLIEHIWNFTDRSLRYECIYRGSEIHVV